MTFPRFRFVEPRPPELLGFAMGDAMSDSDIAKIADLKLPHVQTSLLHGFAAFWGLLSDVAKQGILVGDLKYAQNELTLLKVQPVFNPFKSLIEDLLVESAQSVLSDLPKVSGIQLSFELDNPLVRPWIDSHVGGLVTQISAEQVQMLRNVIGGAYTDGIHPFDQATQIQKFIGLLPQHAQAVSNMRSKMLEQSADPVLVDKTTARYARKLLTYRARNIARTETMTAVNAGQDLAWKSAQSSGLLPATQKSRWSAAPSERTCLHCTQLHGHTVPLGGEFEPGLRHPPAHPSCRCSLVLDFTGTGVGIPKTASELLGVTYPLRFFNPHHDPHSGEFSKGSGSRGSRKESGYVDRRGRPIAVGDTAQTSGTQGTISSIRDGVVTIKTATGSTSAPFSRISKIVASGSSPVAPLLSASPTSSGTARAIADHPVLAGWASKLIIPNYDLPEVQKHVAEMAKISPAILKRLENHVNSLTIMPSASLWGAKGMNPLYANDAGLNDGTVVGIYNPATKAIAVGSARFGGATIIHELGHALAHGEGLLDDSQLVASYNKHKNSKSIVAHAREDKDEFFAESFADRIHTGKFRVELNVDKTYADWLESKIS